ncbi:hypothetical protein ACQKWADRAFT_273611 [Trichoderma austrokoningii]
MGFPRVRWRQRARLIFPRASLLISMPIRTRPVLLLSPALAFGALAESKWGVYGAHEHVFFAFVCLYSWIVLAAADEWMR